MSDDDIRHALRHPLRGPIRADDRMLLIGAARNGTPLELVVVDDGDPRVIHAMAARTKYWP